MKTNTLLQTFIALLIFYGTAFAQPSSASALEGALPQSKSRIFFHRNYDFLYLSLSARLKINDVESGSLYRGNTIYSETTPGLVTITVDTLTSPGTYSISFTAIADKEYGFEISPRAESAVTGFFTGITGLFLDSAVNEQSGLFKIEELSQNQTNTLKPSAVPDITDIKNIPYISESGRIAFKEYLEKSPNKAFVIAPNGAWGRAWKTDTRSAIDKALEFCNSRSKQHECFVYAIDDQVVWKPFSVKD